MVRLAAVHARDGHELLPVLWSDNYVALLPGEKRTLSAEFEAGEDVRDLALRVDGWNVPRAVLPVTNLPKRTAISVLHR
jgi:exo-1,4-beta-D-glucosaminidase